MKKRNKIIGFILSLLLTTGQILPVFAAPEDISSETVIAEDTVEVSENEVSEVPEEISVAEDNAFAEDDTYHGLFFPEGYTDPANPVDNSISYAMAMDALVDGDEAYISSAAFNGASVSDRCFPAAYTDKDALVSYFSDNYPIPRNQDPYGSCWAHAALGASEFNLIKQGKADKSINTSELALAYWTYYNGTAGKAGDNGNTVRLAYPENRNYNFLNHGGNSEFAAQTLFQRRGITLESDVPYTSAADVLASQKISPELERKDAYYLNNFIRYDVKSNPDQVKEAVLENGGLTANIYWASARDDGYESYDSTHNSYYEYTKTTSNHAVMIVGWDDNFPAMDFCGKNGKTPTSNGAWLIRNSWNSESFVELSGNSYFWLSYEDSSLNGVDSFQVISANNTGYDIEYFYDTQIYYGYYETQNVASSANVYKATSPSGEELKAVTFDLLGIDTTGCDYTIEVYRCVKEGEGPASGIKMDEATTTGKVYFSGTYTINLKTPVQLEKDEYFGVVVKRSDNKSVTYAKGFDATTVAATCNARDAQSWKDTGNDNWTDNKSRGNYIIHALTKSCDPARIRIDPFYMELEVEKEAEIKVTDASGNAIASNLVKWSSLDTNVATVENGKVKAVGGGRTFIIAEYNGFKAGCAVIVGGASYGSYTVKNINAGSFSYNGKQYALNADISYIQSINYRAKKVKPSDLDAKIKTCTLYDMVKDMADSPLGSDSVLKFTMSAKKNTNAGVGCNFTVKAAVVTKNAKEFSITGSALKQLKKAVKQFNKAASSVEGKCYFEITPVNLYEYKNAGNFIVVLNNSRTKIKGLYARLDPNAPKDTTYYLQWTKLPKKDYTLRKVTISGVKLYCIIPKGKNLVGTDLYYYR